MTWAKIDDTLPENPKVAALSVGGRWAYVSSICYASRNLSDGFIPRSKLTSVDGSPKIAVELVTARLWEAVDGGWVIHDYLKHNRSREKATQVSEGRAVAGRASAAKRQQVVEHPSEQSVLSTLLSSQRTESSRSETPEREKREQNANNLLPADDGLDVGLRERRDTLLASMPARFRYDPDVVESHQFLAEACTDMGVLLLAVRECKAAGETPFARNVRKRLPADQGGMAAPQSTSGTPAYPGPKPWKYPPVTGDPYIDAMYAKGHPDQREQWGEPGPDGWPLDGGPQNRREGWWLRQEVRA